jgi:hypothetical protein
MKKRKRDSYIFEKAIDGWYVEPEWVSARLFEVETFAATVYDPACGGGNILRAASAAGHYVYGGDVVRRGRPRREWNFLRMNFLSAERLSSPPRSDVSIVCNPPFDHVEEFCRRACAMVPKVAMIMLTRRLNAAHWLHDLPLQSVYLLTPRPSMPPGDWIAAGNKPGGGTQDFCWVCFSRGYTGAPELKWLHRDGAKSKATGPKRHAHKSERATI